MLVGRGGEVARLRAAVERARSGSPATVVVAGEAGVGKTRLLGELLDHAQELGVLTLTGGCLDVGGGVVVYAPVVEALRGLVGLLDPGELDRVLDGARPELARLIPRLGAATEPAGTLPPGRLFELLLGVLHRLAETRMVLLAVEDLHWADESTRQLLGFLVRNLRGPVMLVLAYRSDELYRRHPLQPFLVELERSGRAERLELGRLDHAERAELLAEILGEAPPPTLAGEVLARSEGNPFFAEELLAARAEGVGLPDALREVLLARVEKLSEDTQRVLQVAAVAGRQVDHELLAAVAGLPSEHLVAPLREAVTACLALVQHHDLAASLVSSTDVGPGYRNQTNWPGCVLGGDLVHLTGHGATRITSQAGFDSAVRRYRLPRSLWLPRSDQVAAQSANAAVVRPMSVGVGVRVSGDAASCCCWWTAWAQPATAAASMAGVTCWYKSLWSRWRHDRDGGRRFGGQHRPPAVRWRGVPQGIGDFRSKLRYSGRTDSGSFAVRGRAGSAGQ